MRIAVSRKGLNTDTIGALAAGQTVEAAGQTVEAAGQAVEVDGKAGQAAERRDSLRESGQAVGQTEETEETGETEQTDGKGVGLPGLRHTPTKIRRDPPEESAHAGGARTVLERTATA